MVDSLGIVSAVKSITAGLALFFANRVTEIEDEMGVRDESSEDTFEELNLEETLDKKGVTKVDPLLHTWEKLDITYIAMRGNAMLDDIGEDSEWQKGPYLRDERCTWPVPRKFSGDISDEER